jgi:acetyl-CoA carboxylase biotin carboxyl carrier protein
VARRKGSRRGAVGTEGSWSVEEVVELATRHNLAELEVESGGIRIRVVREYPTGAATLAQRAELAAAHHAERHPAAEDGAAVAHLVTVEAPMVGTFYRASAPDAAPFVHEGDIVKEGQVLCIIEAMKLMNEIEAKMAGRIAKILVENGQPVEYGQPLFLVEPRR